MKIEIFRILREMKSNSVHILNALITLVSARAGLFALYDSERGFFRELNFIEFFSVILDFSYFS